MCLDLDETGSSEALLHAGAPSTLNGNEYLPSSVEYWRPVEDGKGGRWSRARSRVGKPVVQFEEQHHIRRAGEEVTSRAPL